MPHRTLLVLSVICCLAPAAPANDIVDFLRALQGPSTPQYRTVSARGRVEPSHHDEHDHVVQSVRDRRDVHSARDSHVTRDLRNVRSHVPVATQPRSRVSFNISFGNAPRVAQLPVAPSPRWPAVYDRPGYPAPPAPGAFWHLSHQLGDVVTCNVPLETCVRVRDACKIAPGAIPVVVAVRDPHLGRFGSCDCVEQLAYVEILAPPCPVQSLRVSPCKTRIRIDYGRYEVTIVSRNGTIDIDYDN